MKLNFFYYVILICIANTAAQIVFYIKYYKRRRNIHEALFSTKNQAKTLIYAKIRLNLGNLG